LNRFSLAFLLFWIASPALADGSLSPGQAPVFAGWFQPLTLALMLGIPLTLLLIYRRGDLARYVRQRAWKSQAGDNS
jgi:hypothetical protein